MNILLDQGTPAPLRRYLPGHTVATTYEQGWASLANGRLLDAAEQAGYDLLITTDQNLRYQQNFADGLLFLFCAQPLGRASKVILI